MKTEDRLRTTAVFGLAAVAFLLTAACVCVGTSIPAGDVVRTVFDAAAGRATDPALRLIVFDVRLPTAITAAIAGAALALAGLQMQTVFRNPLAGPDVLGVTAGASLGVAVVALAGPERADAFLPGGLGMGTLVLVSAASLGAAAVLALALVVGRHVREPATLLILGLMFGAVASGAVGFLVTFSSPQRLQAYVRWTLGSFAGSWRELAWFAPISFGVMAVVLLASKPLNALLLGPDYAQSVGVSIRRTQSLFLVTSAMLGGVVTAFCGPIAFLGVATPHLARAFLRTADHRWLLPGAALLGASLGLVVEIATKLPAGRSLYVDAVLPANTVSGLVGAPLVIWIVLRYMDRGRGL